MGNSASMQQQPLQPLRGLPAPTGVIPQLCNPYEVTLCLKEQVSWSGDTFQIRDVNGIPCFLMKGRAMSFTQKKVLQDLQGQPILNFRREFSIFKKYVIHGGAGQTGMPLATIKVSTILGVSAEIDFINMDGISRTWAMEGNFFASRATIIDRSTGMVVGRIQRHRWNANDLLWNKQTYYVTAAPNVDLALIICICVALDEAKHDK